MPGSFPAQGALHTSAPKGEARNTLFGLTEGAGCVPGQQTGVFR